MSAGQFDCQDDWCGGKELPILENYYLINSLKDKKRQKRKRDKM